MPLGDNRMASSDLGTRFVGGLLATNLIQYWEYSRNLTTLREKIYPFVKDNAEFYLSYATKGSDGKLLFPYTCAQEGCGCRDAAFVKQAGIWPIPNETTTCTDPKSPMLDRCPGASGWMLNHPCYECYPDISTGSSEGNHNAHPDVAFASSSFRNAVRFAKLLGVDSAMAAEWQAALDNMPSYPGADFHFISGVPGSEFNGGAGYFVEAEYVCALCAVPASSPMVAGFSGARHIPWQRPAQRVRLSDVHTSRDQRNLASSKIFRNCWVQRFYLLKF